MRVPALACLILATLAAAPVPLPPFLLLLLSMPATVAMTAAEYLVNAYPKA